MITSTQAIQYLDQALGVSVPSFIVGAAIERVAPAEQAMLDAGYTSSDRVLIQCMAVAIIAAAGSPRRIQSQSGASGASRSFKNADGDLSALRRSLASLDKAGTVSELVGPDPQSMAMLLIV